MKTNFNISIAILTAGTGFLSCTPELQKVPRPNIVFIMSDDHAYQAISAYTDELIQTPNIDRLAAELVMVLTQDLKSFPFPEFHHSQFPHG